MESLPENSYVNAVESKLRCRRWRLSGSLGLSVRSPFLAVFGNKESTIKRLRKGGSDVPGGVLQRSNIHLAVSQPVRVGEMLQALRGSPKTAAVKARFILSDGETLEALQPPSDLACGFEPTTQWGGRLVPEDVAPSGGCASGFSVDPGSQCGAVLTKPQG